VIRFATAIGWWVSLVPAHTTSNGKPLNFRTYDASLRFPKSMLGRVDAILAEVKSMRDQGFYVYDSDPYFEEIRRHIHGEPLTWRDRSGGVCDSPNLYFAVLPNADMAVCCDWRMPSKISVAAANFPEIYRKKSTFDEAQSVASRCDGCLYGSFPEISISARYFQPMLKRALFFGKKPPDRQLAKLSAEQMLQIAADIRAKSPHLYRQVATNKAEPKASNSEELGQ